MPRKVDPTRAKRGTGKRPMPHEKKPTIISVQEGMPIPEPPEDMPEQAAAMFRRAVQELAPRGLRDTDLESIAMMVHAAHLHKQARDGINKHGLLVKGPRGPMVNPLVRVARDEASTYLRLANEFGLTLAARLRLGLMQLAGQSLLGGLNDDLDSAVAEAVVQHAVKEQSLGDSTPDA